MDKFDILMYALCIGTIVGGAVFGTWALFVTMTLQTGIKMQILKTECTDEQQKKDMPELLKMHAEALQVDMMWEFFGGTITLPNGNVYQVAEYQQLGTKSARALFAVSPYHIRVYVDLKLSSIISRKYPKFY